MYPRATASVYVFDGALLRRTHLEKQSGRKETLLVTIVNLKGHFVIVAVNIGSFCAPSFAHILS